MVVEILEENEMQEKRACKMEIIEFLNMLKIFNEKGIHFKWDMGWLSYHILILKCHRHFLIN